jgi:RNA polymerase sigma factor (sigma-70 family)
MRQAGSADAKRWHERYRTLEHPPDPPHPRDDVVDLERRLADARPRLVRLARVYGVAADAVEDAAQETLLIAWRRLAQAQSAEHLDAWLNTICHHIAQHYIRASQRIARHTGPIAQTADEDGERSGFDGALADELDLTEALHREDLERLLDQALGQLTSGAREIIELCYLAELPQREVATRLGLTLSSLEARLHRTRRQLREVIHGQLRPMAEDLGLVLDADESVGWRETREWCNFCGRRRLRGTFEHHPSGVVNFRLRCPDCSERFGGDIYSTGGLINYSRTRAFRPALRRLIRLLKEHYAADYMAALQQGWQVCPGCKRAAPVQLIGPGGLVRPFMDQARVIIACPRCGTIVSPAALAAYRADKAMSPPAMEFVDTHVRWQMQPDRSVEYDGRAAFEFRLADSPSAAELTVVADARTLEVLAVHQQ